MIVISRSINNVNEQPYPKDHLKTNLAIYAATTNPTKPKPQDNPEIHGNEDNDMTSPTPLPNIYQTTDSNACHIISHSDDDIITISSSTSPVISLVQFLQTSWDRILSSCPSWSYQQQQPQQKKRRRKRHSSPSFESQLSQTLILLHTVMMEAHIERQRQQQDADDDDASQQQELRQRQQRSYRCYKTAGSPMGMALFFPLDTVAHDELSWYDEDNNTTTPSITSTNTSTTDDDQPESNNVTFSPEPPSTLLTSPPLLSTQHTSTINSTLQSALPYLIQYSHHWKRLYALSRDGDCFSTFLDHVKGHQRTLLVVKTTRGKMFGGYVGEEWGRLRDRWDGSFYGVGQSFLFRVVDNEMMGDDDDDDSRESVVIYKWTGLNDYFQYNHCGEGRLAMGGGGSLTSSFGLCLRDNFTRGFTGRCDTFGNEPLTGGDDEEEEEYFDIWQFEVYGFVPCWG